MLVVYGTAPLAFAVDMGIDRNCLGMWSATGDPMFFLYTDIAPTLAALCVLAAVRTPRHRFRRLAASRTTGRGSPWGSTPSSALPVPAGSSPAFRTTTCSRTGARDAVRIGAAWRTPTSSRPSAPAQPPGEDGLLREAQKNGLVAAGPGHLIVLSHSDFDICFTVETYRRRPPLELKGWDKVVEVGYESTTGQVRLMDPMAGQDDLPNLAFRGKGRYRIRVHYRRPDYDAWTPQHILLMVYPGRARPPVEYRRSPR